MSINHRGDGVGRIVKSVDEFEAQRQTQREEQKEAAANGNCLSEETHDGTNHESTRARFQNDYNLCRNTLDTRIFIACIDTRSAPTKSPWTRRSAA